MSIDIKNISIKYGKHRAINDVTLKIPEGKITTILGPNGCGKTTTLRSISGNIKLEKGAIEIDGRNIRGFKNKELARTLAYLPQFHHTPASVSVEELVGYGRNPYISFLSQLGSKDKEVIDWALEQTNLIEYRDRQVLKLSGGERQRVWLAMILAQEAKYVLLDEPINNLDLCYQIEVLELIRKLNRTMKVTIIMVLHDVNYAIRYSDYIVAMKDGKIYREGIPSMVVDHQLLKDIFNIKGVIGEDDNTKYIIPKGIAL